MKLMGGTGRGSCMVNTIWGVFGSARPLPSLSRITGTVIQLCQLVQPFFIQLFFGIALQRMDLLLNRRIHRL